MTINTAGLNLIKSFESCRLTAYQDSVGVWTIGWGHTGTVDGVAIHSGMTITQAKADELLSSDLVRFENNVNSYDSIYNWTSNEFSALVSFAYNIGSINQLTARGTRSKAVIAQKMLEYNKAGGKVLPGLVRRREAEQKLFLTPDSETPEQPTYPDDPDKGDIPGRRYKRRMVKAPMQSVGSVCHTTASAYHVRG